MTHHDSAHQSPAMNECIDNCTSCHAICLETISHCLSKGGAHAAPEHIALLAACADICSTCAATMLRGASVSAAVCGACAEVCRACADSCERMGDDPQMKRCAEVCRRCAESCTAMAAMPGH
jgi:hypothetical protein